MAGEIRRYPEIWNLKLKLPFILKYVREGESILDVGAFDRALGERIRSRCPSVRYKSMDIDSTYPHDYYSLEEIRETFDVILLFEVIEHLESGTRQSHDGEDLLSLEWRGEGHLEYPERTPLDITGKLSLI